MIERLLLVDLGAIYWHSWHSSNSDSAPDASAEATLSRVRRWADEYRWLAVCLDDPAGTFRHQLYPAYKSTRSEKPAGAAAQLRRTIELLQRECFVCWQADAHEADDVIASATRVAVAAGLSVTIASRDKDLHSLVSERVLMLDYTTGNTRDVAAVQAKYGVHPQQIPDWLTLTGDAADAIPGVPNVGPTKAAELLRQSATIEGIYRRLDSILQHEICRAGHGDSKREALLKAEFGERYITPSVRNGLCVARDTTLELSRKLVALVDTLEIPLEDALRNADRPCECVYPEGCPVCLGDRFAPIPSKPISPPDMARLENALARMKTAAELMSELQPEARDRMLDMVSNEHEHRTPTPQPAPEVPPPPPSRPLVQPGRLETHMANDNAVAPANGAAKTKRTPKFAVAQGLPSSPFTNIILGGPGIGKSWFCSDIPGRHWIPTEDGFKGVNPERKGEIACFRDRRNNPIIPQSYGDMCELIEEYNYLCAEREEPTQHRHMVFDGMTQAERLVHLLTCKQESVAHMDAKAFSDVYAASKPHWIKLQMLLTQTQRVGSHVWVVAHSHDAKQTVGETGEQYIKQDLAFQGSGRPLVDLRQIWRTWADNVLFMDWKTSTHAAKTKKTVARYEGCVFYTSETPQRFAKNRCQLPDTIPANWEDLSKAMKAGQPSPEPKLRRDIEATMPQLSDEQRSEIATALAAAKSASALSAVLRRAKGMAATNEQTDAPGTQEPGNDDGKDAAE